jgi:hypothetical protein
MRLERRQGDNFVGTHHAAVSGEIYRQDRRKSSSYGRALSRISPDGPRSAYLQELPPARGAAVASGEEEADGVLAVDALFLVAPARKRQQSEASMSISILA